MQELVSFIYADIQRTRLEARGWRLKITFPKLIRSLKGGKAGFLGFQAVTGKLEAAGGGVNGRGKMEKGLVNWQ